jgi:predicted acyl esterase
MLNESEMWGARLGPEPWALEWLRQQVDGPYWRAGSNSRIKCATYLIGGWKDGYRNAPLRTFEALDCPKKLLMGPWSHNLPESGIPGPHIDFVAELARWFGYWLNGVENGVLADDPVTPFIQEAQPPNPIGESSSGFWIRTPTVPAAETTERFLTNSRALAVEPEETPAVVANTRGAVGRSLGWCVVPGESAPSQG